MGWLDLVTGGIIPDGGAINRAAFNWRSLLPWAPTPPLPRPRPEDGRLPLEPVPSHPYSFSPPPIPDEPYFGGEPGDSYIPPVPDEPDFGEWNDDHSYFEDNFDMPPFYRLPNVVPYDDNWRVI